MSDNKERKDVIKVLEGWTSRCKHSSNSIIKLEKKKTKKENKISKKQDGAKEKAIKGWERMSYECDVKNQLVSVKRALDIAVVETKKEFLNKMCLLKKQFDKSVLEHQKVVRKNVIQTRLETAQQIFKELECVEEIVDINDIKKKWLGNKMKVKDWTCKEKTVLETKKMGVRQYDETIQCYNKGCEYNDKKSPNQCRASYNSKGILNCKDFKKKKWLVKKKNE